MKRRNNSIVMFLTLDSCPSIMPRGNWSLCDMFIVANVVRITFGDSFCPFVLKCAIKMHL